MRLRPSLALIVVLACLTGLVGTAAAFSMSGGRPPSAARLQSALIRSGDLPAGLVAGQIRARPPAMFNPLPRPAVSATREFNRAGVVNGGVSVLVYTSAAQRNLAFRRLLAGEGGTKAYGPLPGARYTVIAIIPAVDLLFTRCNTVVHIRMSGSGDPDDPGSYALRLVARLAPLIC